jgi:hypothetical protein
MIRKWGDPEYYIVRIGNHAFTVAKFTTSAVPDQTYNVRYESCTCPVGFDCKHVRLSKAFMERGEPEMWIWNIDGKGAWHGEPLKGIGGRIG